MHPISSGTLELVKWFALILMTGDHVNKYLFNATLPLLYDAGRVALPLFIFVLAYNLSREEALARGVFERAKIHLLGAAMLSSFPYILMNGYSMRILPLNVLFTLLVITLIIENINKNDYKNYLLALVVFFICSPFVEYGWEAVVLGVSTWSYNKYKNVVFLLVSVFACFMLYLINNNYWAMLALPIFYIVSNIDIQFPRVRWAFYVYYPLHLTVIYLIRIPMKKAGYLFF